MRLGSVIAAGLLGIATVALIPTAQAVAAPEFQLPFPCGQSWHGNNDDSGAHRTHEIDFNRGDGPAGDLGDTVVAAAEGTVRIAAHQGSTNGYGNLVKIEHAGDYFTYYAHLNTIAVAVGETVSRGQSIGTVGNTSKPGNNIGPHLHYEVRLGSSGYPDNIQKATFDGTTFDYPDADVTSKNCSTPHDPAEVCGAGYQVIDSARLDTAGAVDLLWNGSSKSNCVVALKFTSVGTPSPASAYLEPEGADRVTKSGDVEDYAGPASAAAPGCVKWGGSVGEAKYDSPSEHCG